MNLNMSENTSTTLNGGGRTLQLPQQPLMTHSWTLPTLGEQKRHDVLQQLTGDPRGGETVQPKTSKDFELIKTPVDDRIDGRGSLSCVNDSVAVNGQYPYTFSGNYTPHNQHDKERHEQNTTPRQGQYMTLGRPITVQQRYNQSAPPFNPTSPGASDVGRRYPSCTYAENPRFIPRPQVCYQDRPTYYTTPDRGTYFTDQEQFEACGSGSEMQPREVGSLYGGGKTSQLPQPPLMTHSWKLTTLNEQKRHNSFQLHAGDPRGVETVLSTTSEDFKPIKTPVDDGIDGRGSLSCVNRSITVNSRYPYTFSGNTPHNQHDKERHEQNTTPRQGQYMTLGRPITVQQSYNQSAPPFNPTFPGATDVGRRYPSCTYAENRRFIPRPQVCYQDRPTYYTIPDRGTYLTDQEQFEARRSGMKLCEMFQREKSETRNQNRQELFEASDLNLTVNQTPFECPICLTVTEANQGVRLQECLHEICRNCCANHINLSNDAEIMCPYTDGENACQQTITHREIRQIVEELHYDKFVKRSLNLAEAQSTDSFHCLTPNCEGFCFYHKDRTFFQCPICLSVSCFNCKVIHEGQTCREYKYETERKVINEHTAKQTEEELQRLLREGRAMNCPKCGVVIQKNGGCPNMTCSKCNTAFKWTGIDM